MQATEDGRLSLQIHFPAFLHWSELDSVASWEPSLSVGSRDCYLGFLEPRCLADTDNSIPIYRSHESLDQRFGERPGHHIVYQPRILIPKVLSDISSPYEVPA